MQFVPFKEKLINDNREARIGQPNNLKLPSALTSFLISPPAGLTKFCPRPLSRLYTYLW
jgi:hypothetical protein